VAGAAGKRLNGTPRAARSATARGRLLAVAAALLLALAAPLARALDPGAARHLLVRTGFGATPEAIAALAPLDWPQAVDRVLATVRTEARTPPPAWIDDPLPQWRRILSMSERERARWRMQVREQGIELKAWWYREMLETDSPLTERLVLFWHNHFTSALSKVRFPALMHRQNALLRRHALGSYRALLHAVARDPAMVWYLDGQTNRAGRPNENFARELLELFTLGEGHYRERDVKEVARAFTGYGLDWRTGSFRFRPRQHDDGVKTVLGRTGSWNGDDVIDLVLDEPRAAEHVVEKLWRELVSYDPDPAEVTRLAARFRSADYELRPLVRALLLTPAFRDPALRGRRIQPPAVLLVGTLRTFDVDLRDTRVLARAGRFLGQDLLDPPNVKGWPGGERWITTTTLALRQKALERIVSGPEGLGPEDAAARRAGMRMGAGRLASAPDPGAAAAQEEALEDRCRIAGWLEALPAGARSRAALTALLLPVPPAGGVPPGDACETVRALVADPAYQLM